MISTPVPGDFRHQDARGNRGVEGINMPLHRDRHHGIAGFPHQAGYALPLRADDQRAAAGEIDVIKAFAVHIGSIGPDILLFLWLLLVLLESFFDG